MQKCYGKIGGEGKMCTVGGGPDIGNIETLAAKDYECLDCKNQFKGMGRRPMCPSCKSRNVKAV
jgi:Zn finger protein HypA/HybF involved in hydrogenase expression